jgi:hypothetical protein
MSIAIYVDLDEVYHQMDSWDKRTMLDYLRDDGYLTDEPTGVNDGVSITIPTDSSIGQEEHLRLVSKLGGLYFRISDEDMEIIRNIVKKY